MDRTRNENEQCAAKSVNFRLIIIKILVRDDARVLNTHASLKDTFGAQKRNENVNLVGSQP